jgi:antitoxin ParD1/3/4
LTLHDPLTYADFIEEKRVTSLNISLPDPMKKFIETEVKRIGYSTPSEYVRALVRAEQKRKAEDRLEALLLEGIESGKSIPRNVVMQRLRPQRIDRTHLAPLRGKLRKGKGTFDVESFRSQRHNLALRD